MPPAAVMTAAISLSAQATTTGPTRDATARRQTWTIIGTPAISASGLRASRVDCSRAGMMMIGVTSGPRRCALWIVAALCRPRPWGLNNISFELYAKIGFLAGLIRSAPLPARFSHFRGFGACLLYTSDAADDLLCV